SPLRAYVKAVHYKIRPIALTVISTIAGLVPFLIGGQQAAFWFALAAGAIGGLSFSLITTFLILPLFLPVKNAKPVVST
ncbi:MAG: hypothetical protein OEY51_13770, partial [Cyclobacteriaceae bacterium]|nr:hypothetical protein [Cyclobacteriaceae bacterium]